MPINILMPALSPTMEKGNLAKWLKKEGEKVKPGDVIAEIETDKATMEVEAVDEGTLGKILVPEGTQDVAVNDVIAVLAGDGEDVKAAGAGAASAPKAAPAAEAPAAAKPAPAVAPAAAPAAKAAAPAAAAPQPAPAQQTNGHARTFSSPLARRLALLEWARLRKTWIIEDDYDSEYRYQGKPLPALMGVDDSGVVVSLGSFSKTMLPGLRISYLVVPHNLINDVSAVMRERGARVSIVLQPVLAEFMRLGHYAIHIRRMRRLYTRRQQALREAIEHHAGDLLSTSPEPAGMHLICTLRNGMNDRDASKRAAKAGLLAPALSDYFAGEPFRQGLVLGYAGFDETIIDTSIKTLAQALR